MKRIYFVLLFAISWSSPFNFLLKQGNGSFCSLQPPVDSRISSEPFRIHVQVTFFYDARTRWMLVIMQPYYLWTTAGDWRTLKWPGWQYPAVIIKLSLQIMSFVVRSIYPNGAIVSYIYHAFLPLVEAIESLIKRSPSSLISTICLFILILRHQLTICARDLTNTHSLLASPMLRKFVVLDWTSFLLIK